MQKFANGMWMLELMNFYIKNALLPLNPETLKKNLIFFSK